MTSNGNWTEWSTIQGEWDKKFQIGQVRRARTIWNNEQNYPWTVRHKVQLPINHINNKKWEWQST